jgi:Peptidase family C25
VAIGHEIPWSTAAPQYDVLQENVKAAKGNTVGVIFTNISRLAPLLKVKYQDIRALIEQYIQAVARTGHQYFLLDAGDKKYSQYLKNNSWQSHVYLLAKMSEAAKIDIGYLFIIGSSNVIPMPTVPVLKSLVDQVLATDLDTDMPYSYLVNNQFEQLLWSGKLFSSDLRFLVGRLPFGTDAVISHLATYLKMATQIAAERLHVHELFGLGARVWAETTKAVVSGTPLDTTLYLSPECDLGNIDQVFNFDAQLFYFNLHGSDAQRNPNFSGEYPAHKYYPALSPRQMLRTKHFNMVVTEACFGGKFENYECSLSMLLSSMSHATVAYVGSSRVALGTSAPPFANADLVAHSFLSYMVQGYSCGLSFTKARLDSVCQAFEFSSLFGIHAAAEFNLFGDPILTAEVTGAKVYSHDALHHEVQDLKSAQPVAVPEVKELNVAGKKGGLLSFVRDLVNEEVLKIRDQMRTYLYEQYGIEERHLSNVFELKAHSGNVYYNYHFQLDTDEYQQHFLVFTDKAGDIKQVLMSK